MTREVPRKFWNVHVSPRKKTASIDASIGAELTTGTERDTPIRSIPM
jgi:hypothetical protein